MGFLNIEKKKNNNNQGAYFNPNPNMMGNDMYNPGMPQQPMMGQPMMNPGMDMNPNMGQPMMNPNMNQPMMNPGMDMNPNMNQPMMSPNMNQPMMNPDMDMNPNRNQPMGGPRMDMNPNRNQPMNPGMDMNPNRNQPMMNQPPNNNNQGMMNNGMNNRNMPPQSMKPLPRQEVKPPVTMGPSRHNSDLQNFTRDLERDNGRIDFPKEEKEEVLDELDTLDDVSLPREVENKIEEVKKEEKKQEAVEDKPKEEEKKIDGDVPLSSINAPSFLNPILEQADKYQNVEDIGDQKNVKANFFAAIGIIIGMIVKPGTTMLKNAKKFNKTNKAVAIMLWMAGIFLVLCIGVRLLVGSFDRSYSSLTDSYRLVFNPTRIFEISNYLEYILISIAVSVGAVLLTALVYYASSFLNSKGVHFATYLIVSNLGLVPLIVGTIVLYPIGMIFSVYLGIGALIFAFLISLITVLNGMNEVLTFKNINFQIFYHVINLSIVTLIAIMVFVVMLHQGWVGLPAIGL